jgi:hypothetical protein
MESFKNMSANIFSKKPESEKVPVQVPVTAEKSSSSFSYTYIIGFLFLVALVYYFRDQAYSLYQVYVADSVRRMFGETMLQMNLSPKGEYVSTYVPDLATFGKMVGLQNANNPASNLQEVGLDSIGV